MDERSRAAETAGKSESVVYDTSPAGSESVPKPRRALHARRARECLSTCGNPARNEVALVSAPQTRVARRPGAALGHTQIAPCVSCKHGKTSVAVGAGSVTQDSRSLWFNIVFASSALGCVDWMRLASRRFFFAVMRKTSPDAPRARRGSRAWHSFRRPRGIRAPPTVPRCARRTRRQNPRRRAPRPRRRSSSGSNIPLARTIVDYPKHHAFAFDRTPSGARRAARSAPDRSPHPSPATGHLGKAVSEEIGQTKTGSWCVARVLELPFSRATQFRACRSRAIVPAVIIPRKARFFRRSAAARPAPAFERRLTFPSLSPRVSSNPPPSFALRISSLDSLGRMNPKGLSPASRTRSARLARWARAQGGSGRRAGSPARPRAARRAYSRPTPPRGWARTSTRV